MEDARGRRPRGGAGAQPLASAAAAVRPVRLGRSAQDVLDARSTLRRALDRQRDTDLPPFASKLLLVVGKAAFTPAGYQIGPDGVVYLDAPDQGDGRVTLESAVLPGVAHLGRRMPSTARCPRHKEAFEAYRELAGQRRDPSAPRRWPRHRPRGAGAAMRPAARAEPSRRDIGRRRAAAARDRRALRPRSAAPASRPRIAARRCASRSSTATSRYVAEPLLIGHYRALRLTGAEAVMDRAIGGAMSASLRRGLYPLGSGTHQVFVNITADPTIPGNCRGRRRSSWPVSARKASCAAPISSIRCDRP